MDDKISWPQLTFDLVSYSEDEVNRLLADEIAVHRRPSVAIRLHQRSCKLRALRERRDMVHQLTREARSVGVGDE